MKWHGKWCFFTNSLQGELDSLSWIFFRFFFEGISDLTVLVSSTSPRSYGPHVAKMAGIPTPIVQRAIAISEEFEGQSKTRQLQKKRANGLGLTLQADAAFLIRSLITGLGTGTSAEKLNILQRIQSSFKGAQAIQGSVNLTEETWVSFKQPTIVYSRGKCTIHRCACFFFICLARENPYALDGILPYPCYASRKVVHLLFCFGAVQSTWFKPSGTNCHLVVMLWWWLSWCLQLPIFRTSMKAIFDVNENS